MPIDFLNFTSNRRKISTYFTFLRLGNWRCHCHSLSCSPGNRTLLTWIQVITQIWSLLYFKQLRWVSSFTGTLCCGTRRVWTLIIPFTERRHRISLLCRRIRHRDGLRRQHPRWSLSTIQAPTNMFEITKDGQVPRILSFKSFARNLYQRLKLRKAFQQMAKDDMDPTSNLGGKKHCSSQFRCARVDSTRTSIQSIFFCKRQGKSFWAALL